jgi:hypothetical protein
MGFAGWAPEVVNGRVAQIAFVAGVGAEAVTGETLPNQFHDHVFSLAFVSTLVFLASFAPGAMGKKVHERAELEGRVRPVLANQGARARPARDGGPRRGVLPRGHHRPRVLGQVDERSPNTLRRSKGK